MTLPKMRKRSINVITREELLQKIQNGRPGCEEHPGHPPLMQYKPKYNCPRCEGTGWALSEAYGTFFICKCTIYGDPGQTPVDYTDV
jgi:hypothetical protein